MEKYCPKCFKKYPMEVEVCPSDGSFLVSSHEKDLTGEVPIRDRTSREESQRR